VRPSIWALVRLEPLARKLACSVLREEGGREAPDLPGGEKMPDSDLDSLVYVSSAVRLLDVEEISYLLKRARERNKEYGITGVLLYIGGNFMQYIEGPKDNLDIIYKIICEDKQHAGIIMVSRETIEDRQFGDWSMAFQTKDFEGYVGSPSERKLIDMILELPDNNPSAVRIVLHSFWGRSGT